MFILLFLESLNPLPSKKEIYTNLYFHKAS